MQGGEGKNVRPLAGALLDRTHPVGRSVVGMWVFGGGALTPDLSGGGNNATRVGAPVPTGSPLGGATRVPTSSDYWTLGNPQSLNFVTRFTAVAWVRRQVTVAAGVFAIARDDSTTRGWGLGMNGAGQFYLEVGGTLAVQGGMVMTGPVSANNNGLYMLALTRDDTTWRGYVNGTLVGTSAAALGSCNAEYRIGQRAYPGVPSAFQGDIDHVWLANRPLSSVDIQAVYANPFGMFRRTWTMIPAASPPSVTARGAALFPCCM